MEDEYEVETPYEGYDPETPLATTRGISGEIESEVWVKRSYPCIEFKEGFKASKFKMEALAKMVKSGATSKAPVKISIYVPLGGETREIGKISGRQVESLIRLVGSENLIGFFEEGKKLEDDMLLVLCD